MSVSSGWYPDPGGQPGLFRYWDGHSWSASTSTNPQVPPPNAGPYAVPAQKKSPIGWILGGVGVLVVLIVAVLLIVQLLSRGKSVDPPGPTSSASASSSAATCPESTPDTTTPAPSTGARVSSGHLSYPRLGSPFQPPIFDDRVPFGVDIQNQVAPLERTPDGKASWAANVLIARLLAGDGFFGPEQGSKIVVACILGKFYGDNKILRHDIKNQATTVDGHPAWLVESQLSYNIPGIKAKSELMIVEVIATSAGEAGLFYSSLPDTDPQLVPKAEAAMADLQVS